ncbi:O-methyltransferase [Flavihumibacter sp. ZG627]|uniref:O-methyltransferase n=1 Tax=Flavihumibacter sp. ZG627 TaxID=1463156 RepID=UPI00057E2574|nr:O-methyltransferase [Flavihumibacter sp. ZG627]KIC90474.1 methyltransferase [Flavihumibacter sp. ZG627]
MDSLELVNPLANAYAEKFSSPEPELLRNIAEETNRTHPQAHMLSGHLQGRLLAMLSRLVQPKYILEIGSFTGYSALCLAEGLVPGGELHTIELRNEEATVARRNFRLSPYADQVILHEGVGTEIIPVLDRPWDLVFIDADKTGYIDYYELVVPQLRNGGLIIADNVLFHGQVLENPPSGKNAKAMQAFNEHVAADGRVERVMVTIRDGLLLLQKKNIT